jgi:hypothetical protein
MSWMIFVARFFAGVFLANGVPHFISGVQGQPFPTPFASPPGKGYSSPVVNVLWGTFNVAIGYLLIYQVGDFNTSHVRELLAAGIGGLLVSLQLASHFGGVRASRHVGQAQTR